MKSQTRRFVYRHVRSLFDVLSKYSLQQALEGQFVSVTGAMFVFKRRGRDERHRGDATGMQTTVPKFNFCYGFACFLVHRIGTAMWRFRNVETGEYAR